MADETTESRNQARLAILELANKISVPMSLNAVVRLNVADAIWQNGANTPLSAAQILAKVLPSGGGDSENLQRILHILASYGVFAEHQDAVCTKRKYSLTEIGKTLVTDADGLSYAAYVLQHHQVRAIERIESYGGGQLGNMEEERMVLDFEEIHSSVSSVNCRAMELGVESGREEDETNKLRCFPVNLMIY